MIRLLIFLQISLLASCSGQNCPYIGEVPYLHFIANQKDAGKVCRYYEANRAFFFEQRNSAHSADEVRAALSDLDLSPASVDTFMTYWAKDVENHRQTTLKRDSAYREGVACLQALLDHDIKNFENYLSQAQGRLDGVVSESDQRKIKKGIREYLAFVERKQRDFLEEETLLYGQLGSHIIQYNQLSFEVIKRVMTSEYDFGFEKDFKKEMAILFDKYEALSEELETYRKFENEIVEKLTAEDCLKRVGVLRYYDQLNEAQIEAAMKIKLLMNVFGTD